MISATDLQIHSLLLLVPHVWTINLSPAWQLLVSLVSLSHPFLSTDDKGNFLIQWLSRADPEFPAPKISSSKRPLSSGQAAACTAPAPACHLAFSLALWLCYTLPWLLLLLLSGACCLSLPLLLLLFREFRGLFLPDSPPLKAHLGSESIRALRVRGSRCNRQWGRILESDERLFLVEREGFFYRRYTRKQPGVLEIGIP